MSIPHRDSKRKRRIDKESLLGSFGRRRGRGLVPLPLLSSLGALVPRRRLVRSGVWTWSCNGVSEYLFLLGLGSDLFRWRGLVLGSSLGSSSIGRCFGRCFGCRFGQRFCCCGLEWRLGWFLNHLLRSGLLVDFCYLWLRLWFAQHAVGLWDAFRWRFGFWLGLVGLLGRRFSRSLRWLRRVIQLGWLGFGKLLRLVGLGFSRLCGGGRLSVFARLLAFE